MRALFGPKRTAAATALCVVLGGAAGYVGRAVLAAAFVKLLFILDRAALNKAVAVRNGRNVAKDVLQASASACARVRVARHSASWCRARKRETTQRQ